MSPSSPERRLDLPQDLRFIRRSWIAERAGTIVLFLFLIGGLLGVFGSGPLSQTTAGAGDGPLWLEYPRFAHYDTGSVLRVHVRPRDPGDLDLWLDRAYLRAVQVEHLEPQPLRVRAEEDRQVYSFARGASAAEVLVTIDVTFREFGVVRGRIGTGFGETLEFRQLVYP